jgi:hypothetical protein
MEKTHVYVMIPYRARGKHADRKPQLDFLIPYMAGYLNGQGLEYTLIVIEQNDDNVFNYGKIKNCGILECKKLFKDGYKNVLACQNVDVIPKKIKYSGYPVGLTNACGYEFGSGSLCFFDIESFEAANGSPNHLIGYGGDDVSLIERCFRAGVPVRKHEHINNPEYILELDTTYRDNSTNEANAPRVWHDLEENRWKSNGLSNCNYTVDKMTYNADINYYHFWVSW